MDGLNDFPRDPFTGVYERGAAVGHSDVKNDTMVFRFKGEVFELPSAKALEVAEWTGYFYEAPIERLREAASG